MSRGRPPGRAGRLVHHLVRAITVLAVAALVAFAYRTLRPGRETVTAKPRAGEAAVTDAIAVAPARQPIGVRGYVFNGFPAGLRLCAGRRRGHPPECVGPYLDLDGVDAASFNLRRGSLKGVPIEWADSPVTLVGRIGGTRMHVEQVLR